jgi:hypothetical protein
VTKDELQKLYAEIKANKGKISANNTLFKPKEKKGCSSCGKVTWKPNKSN